MPPQPPSRGGLAPSCGRARGCGVRPPAPPAPPGTGSPGTCGTGRDPPLAPAPRPSSALRLFLLLQPVLALLRLRTLRPPPPPVAADGGATPGPPPPLGPT